MSNTISFIFCWQSYNTTWQGGTINRNSLNTFFLIIIIEVEAKYLYCSNCNIWKIRFPYELYFFKKKNAIYPTVESDACFAASADSRFASE